MSAPVLLALALTAAANPIALRFTPEAPRVGDLVVVDIDTDKSAGLELEAFGYAFGVAPRAGAARGYLAVPVDASPGPVLVRLVRGGAPLRTATISVSGRDFERSELRVKKRFTKKKSRKLRRRIRRESKAIAKLWARAPTSVRALGAPVQPVDTEVTSPFGVERVFNDEVQSRHYGLDLDGKTGDPVKAVLPGRVVMSAMRFYSGGTLVLDHGAGLHTLYFHLSKRRVRRGRKVKAGQRLGDVGKSGRVTGPHLHLSVVVTARWLDGESAGKTRGLYVDPEVLLGLDDL